MAHRELELEVSSDLAADRRAVLAEVTTLAGVNRELQPIFRMTAPRPYLERSLFDAPIGQPLFRSWLLLGGVVPIDFDHLALESVDPASGFVESSVMLTMRRWRHERRVTDRAPSGSRVVDRLAFVPRVPGTGPLLAKLVERVFTHRHQRLREWFGTGITDRR